VVPGGGPRTSLVEHHRPEKLVNLMKFELPGNGKGKEGLLATVEQVLKYSVNTWDQGFLDKLYSSTNAVRILSCSKVTMLINFRSELSLR
jgi:glutamate decarboxylase